MSNRLAAPARSELRRVSLEPPPPKTSGKRPESSEKKRQVENDSQTPEKRVSGSIVRDPEAENFKDLASGMTHDLADISAIHMAHLPPAIQRFWERAKLGRLSPRSLRLSTHLPQPCHSSQIMMTLNRVKGGVADEIQHRRIVQEGVAVLLKRHFETIPSGKLTQHIQEMFCAFDTNHDGHLDIHELKDAFSSMGTKLTEEELQVIIQTFDENNNSQFELPEFERMVRSTLHLPLFHDEDFDALDDRDSISQTPPIVI